MLRKAKDKSTLSNKNQFSDRNQRIYDFLQKVRVGVLSTITPDNDPHGVVIYFNIELGFRITFLTRSRTRKYDNLKHNNHAMLTVFDSTTQTTAQISGPATELKDDEEINRIAGSMLDASFKTSEPGLAPITKLEAGDFVAFQIKPAQIRMAVYARPDPGDYNDLFESIESFEFPNTSS